MPFTPEQLDDLDWLAMSVTFEWHGRGEERKEDIEKVAAALPKLTAMIRAKDAPSEESCAGL